jgi:hypothetical protein
MVRNVVAFQKAFWLTICQKHGFNSPEADLRINRAGILELPAINNIFEVKL